jgi:hypothetical protein
MPRKRLGTMLIEAGAISEDALRHALVEQKRWGRSLGQTLVELKLVSEAELLHVLSQQLGVPVVEIDLIDVPFAVLELVPAAFAQEHDLVPFATQLKFLDVAMADPADTQAIDQLQLKTKLNVRRSSLSTMRRAPSMPRAGARSRPMPSSSPVAVVRPRASATPAAHCSHLRRRPARPRCSSAWSRARPVKPRRHARARRSMFAPTRSRLGSSS